MLSYAQLLKELLQFSNTKSLVLANYLGYDVSYISKWCTGVKLPSIKNISTINKEMSHFFSKEIVEKKIGAQFLSEFNLEFPKEKELIQDVDFFENTIFFLLKKSYSPENPNIDTTQRNDLKFIFGTEEVIISLKERIKAEFLNINSAKVELFFTVDFTIANLQPILSLLSKLKKENMCIYLGIGVDLKNLEKYNKKNVEFLFYLLNHYIDLNIEIYNNSNFKYSNILLFKNYFAVQYSLNYEGNFESITYITAEETLEKLSNSILETFQKETKLIRLVDSKKMQKEEYRISFYTNDVFNFFLVKGFEFLLPTNIINNILKYAQEKKYSEESLTAILKVKIAWEEIFENSSINFFILKSSLFNYLEKGELIYINIPYKTSTEEREMHYKNIIETLEKNDKIHFYVIDDDFKYKTDMMHNLAIFVNNKNTFFKNYYNLELGKEPYYIVVNNDILLNNIILFFEDIKNSKYCKEYSSDDLKKFWEKYKNLFFKLTEL